MPAFLPQQGDPARLLTLASWSLSSAKPVADPPKAGAGQDKGEADEDRQLVPLEGPIPAGRLVREGFSELADAGRCRAALQAGPSIEKGAEDEVAGLVDDLGRIDPRAGFGPDHRERPVVSRVIGHPRRHMEGVSVCRGATRCGRTHWVKPTRTAAKAAKVVAIAGSVRRMARRSFDKNAVVAPAQSLWAAQLATVVA